MKKILFILIIFAIIFPILIKDTPDSISNLLSKREKADIIKEKIYVFKYSHSQSISHPRSKSMEYFKQNLEERSKGRIKVELHFEGSLGQEAKVLEQVRIGQLEGCRGGYIERFYEDFLIYTLPFIWDSTESVLKAMRSDFGKDLNYGALKKGFYIPATGVAGGFRNITSNDKPIKEPDDLKGLNIRTPPIQMTLKTFTALDASPHQIAYTETHMALKTDVVAAQENPYSNIVDMKFYEVQKYLTILNWQIHPDPFVVNPDWYGALPDDLKLIFDKVAIETMEYSDEIWLESENEFLEFLKEKMVINILNTPEKSKFVREVKEVWQEYVDEGYFTWEQINSAIDAGK